MWKITKYSSSSVEKQVFKISVFQQALFEKQKQQVYGKRDLGENLATTQNTTCEKLLQKGSKVQTSNNLAFNVNE